MALWITAFLALGLLTWWLWRRRAFVTSWTWGKGRWGVAMEDKDGAGDSFGKEGGFPLVHCRLFCKPSALAHALVQTFCRSTDLDTRQWSWKSWPNLQTVIQLLWPLDRPLEFSRDHLRLEDGGIVALDWVVGPSARVRMATHVTDSTVLVVVPDAAGRITRNVHQLCRLALQEGYYPVIFNRRGHNGCPLSSPKMQPFGDPADLKEAVAYVRFRHPTSTLFAVSEGSGSGLLLSYLGECGSSSYLGGAACISPVLKAQDWFEASIPRWYEWVQLMFQKRCISRYAEALKDVVEMDQALGSCSLRSFEEALFCQGKSRSSTWEVYWDCNDPLRDVDEVAVPVLCLCSADDLIRGPPNHTLPWELFQSNPYFFLLLSPHGGHCGFFGKSPLASWGNTVTFAYLRTVAEFFRLEERLKERPRRKSLATQRHRWRGTLQSRGTSLSPHGTFSWQRSFTR